MFQWETELEVLSGSSDAALGAWTCSSFMHCMMKVITIVGYNPPHIIP